MTIPPLVFRLHPSFSGRICTPKPGDVKPNLDDYLNNGPDPGRPHPESLSHKAAFSKIRRAMWDKVRVNCLTRYSPKQVSPEVHALIDEIHAHFFDRRRMRTQVSFDQSYHYLLDKVARL